MAYFNDLPTSVITSAVAIKKRMNDDMRLEMTARITMNRLRHKNSSNNHSSRFIIDLSPLNELEALYSNQLPLSTRLSNPARKSGFKIRLAMPAEID